MGYADRVKVIIIRRRLHQVKNNIKTADDLRKLQRYMGHANFNTTAHYLQYSSDELRDVTDMWDKKAEKKNKK